MVPPWQAGGGKRIGGCQFGTTRTPGDPEKRPTASYSSGSNLGPTNPALIDEVKARIDALRSADPGNSQPIPVDLVTSSGSGLDPDISVAAALYQVPRVARLRGMSADQLRALVLQYAEDRQFGILGEPRVNVLELNLALQ